MGNLFIRKEEFEGDSKHNESAAVAIMEISLRYCDISNRRQHQNPRLPERSTWTREWCPGRSSRLRIIPSLVTLGWWCCVFGERCWRKSIIRSQCLVCPEHGGAELQKIEKQRQSEYKGDRDREFQPHNREWTQTSAHVASGHLQSLLAGWWWCHHHLEITWRSGVGMT